MSANNGVIAQKTKSAATQKGSSAPAVARPKLVVGIVVDQMRWDYLVRFRPLFKANGGLTRLLSQGYSCENNFIPYTPTVTACGHTCAYTGSVPAIHGITGNAWWDNQLMRNVYCSEDKTVKGVGYKFVVCIRASGTPCLLMVCTAFLTLSIEFPSLRGVAHRGAD